MGNAVDAADNNGNYINDESDEKKQHQQTSILDKVSNGFSKLISNISQKAESSKQRFRYLVVLDFEATTGKEIKRSQREVIEWAAMIIDTKTNKILQGKKHKFHYYIRPQIHPELTKYCQKLTGITQQFIDEYGTRYEIRELTYKWNAWCCGNNLLQTSYHNSTPKACIITCGDNDLNEIWKSQAKISEVDSIDDVGLFHSWINIQEIFKQNITDYNGGCGLMSMLKHLNIDIEGRHHSGINDVENTCKNCLHLLPWMLCL
eukprot:UN11130